MRTELSFTNMRNLQTSGSPAGDDKCLKTSKGACGFSDRFLRGRRSDTFERVDKGGNAECGHLMARVEVDSKTVLTTLEVKVLNSAKKEYYTKLLATIELLIHRPLLSLRKLRTVMYSYSLPFGQEDINTFFRVLRETIDVTPKGLCS